MNHLRSPIRWLGGKGRITTRLLRLVPDTWRYYVEPYFGGCSLFFRLPPAEVETINDIDSAVMDFYRVLRDVGSFERFRELAEFTPYSRELWEECRREWEQEEDPVVRAWRWWVVARASFGAHFGGSFGTAVTASVRGMAMTCSAFRSIIEQLSAIHERLKYVQIECTDGRRVVQRYAVEVAFCYCDPPYLADTRRAGGYRYEMTDDEHEALIDTLLSCPAYVMVSGYDHALYRRLEDAGWNRTEFPSVCSAVPRTRITGMQGTGTLKAMQPRTEVVWRNYRRAGEGASCSDKD